MGRPLFNGAALLCMLFLVSCYSYQAVPAERTYDTGGGSSATYRLAVDRYVARLRSCAPVAAINNRAVDLAEQGRFGQAEILFREVVAEDPREPAGYNNLGVVCEINGRRDEAFRMYTAACRLLPGNAVFMRNFSSFADYRRDGE